MKPELDPFDPALEQALDEIRNERVDDTTVQAAASRVWDRISGEVKIPSLVIHGCADFRALMPDYRAGRLDEARALLLKDHTHECVGCRKALEALQAKVTPINQAAARKPSWSSRREVRWAMVAALAIGVGLGTWNIARNAPDAARGRATVESVNGLLYRVSNDTAVPVQPGEELDAGAEVRTAKNSGAVVRLADGSVVEMRERSGFFVTATYRDMTIHLGRGAVIVEAAKQRKGHLYVSTKDVKVAVTGTVFSVNSGVKGSRVSVVEGEVRVTQNSQEAVLHPGDQYTSSAVLTKTSVEDEISWSQKVDQHIALLKEFTTLGKQLEQVRMPDLRYGSRLLEMVPANTAFYASLPNMGRTLAEAHEIFRNRLQDSPVLRQWWEQKMEGAHGPKVDALIQELGAVSDYLGDEIVVSAGMGVDGHMDAPVLLAEVKKAGLREFLQAEIARLAGDGKKVVFADTPAAIGTGVDGGVSVYISGGVAALSPDANALRQVAANIESRGTGFSGTPFYARIRQAYGEGAGLIFSADLEKVGSQTGKDQTAAFVLGGMKSMLVEQKAIQGQTNTRATFGFAGQRAGLASWLSHPATINALDFISPEATGLGAFVLKSPSTIVDELFAMLEKSNSSFRSELAQAESKLGLSIQNDLASTLGAEVAFALDGPAIPTPAWKLIVEVYDSARLQAALQRLVEAANVEAKAQGQKGSTLTQEAVNGRVYYHITSPAVAKFGDISYVFADGYLVAAPSRVLVDQALSFRGNRTGISQSTKFTSLIPRDSYANFSGVLYHNLGSTIGVLVDGVSNSGSLTAEQRRTIQGLAGDMKPMLVAVYAEDDRITVATTSSAVSLSAANLLAMQGPLGMTSLLEQRRRPAAVRQ